MTASPAPGALAVADQSSVGHPLAPEVANAVMDTVRDSLLLLDRNGHVTFANRSFHQQFRIATDDAEGRSAFVLANGLWDIPALRGLIGNVVERSGFDNHEITHVFPHLGRRTMLLTGRVLHVDGHLPQILLAMHDVTDRTALQEALDQRMRELRRSNADLESFASAASHDLQEPLRKIQAFGERLRSRYAAALDEEGLSYLARMTGAALRMQRLINDLLVYSRLAVRPARMEPVDLRVLASDVVDTLEIRLNETGGSIHLGPLPHVQGDPTHLRLLLQNLLGNALKYHRPGVPPEVHIAGELREQRVRLVVEDNGIGIEPRHMDRIFEPFQRLHSREQYDGTGLGLAICRRVVERHHGSLTGESTPGTGSRFVVDLPTTQNPEST